MSCSATSLPFDFEVGFRKIQAASIWSHVSPHCQHYAWSPRGGQFLALIACSMVQSSSPTGEPRCAIQWTSWQTRSVPSSTGSSPMRVRRRARVAALADAGYVVAPQEPTEEMLRAS
jgi:hypothetical protein